MGVKMHILESVEKFKNEGPYEGQEIFIRNRKLTKSGLGLGFSVPINEILNNKLEEQEIFDILLIRTRKFGKKKCYTNGKEPLLKKLMREHNVGPMG